jgi:hypothetical protein
MTSPAPAPAQVVPRAAAQVQLSGQTFAARARVGVRGRRGLVQGLCRGPVSAEAGARAGVGAVAPGPKRLQIRMLQDVPASEFEKAFTKGMQRNTPDEQVAGWPRAWPPSRRCIRAVGKVRKGDVIDLDWTPIPRHALHAQWHTAGHGHRG